MVLPLVLVIVVAVLGTTLYLTVFRDPGTSTASETSTTSDAPTTAAPTTAAGPETPASTRPTTAAATTTAAGPAVGTELQGVWSGDATLTDCTGFSDSCPSPLPLDLTIGCRPAQCTVTVGGEGFNPGPLYLEGGNHRSNGPVPFGASPTCDGLSVIATWSVTFTVQGEQLVGTYSESSRQTFDCGATNAAWTFTLTRS